MLGLAFRLVSGFTEFNIFFFFTAGLLHIQPMETIFFFIMAVKTMYRVSYIRLHLGFYSVIAEMHIIACYRNSHRPKVH